MGNDKQPSDPNVIARALKQHPRVHMGHLPTPIDPMESLGAHCGITLAVKRDDCTGIAFGGNKVRQLEFYLGDAQTGGADTILITGAVQSNYVRTAAAMANKLGMTCHIQLEERVSGVAELYRTNGNVLLDHLLGATLHSYEDGEDEAGADRSLHALAGKLSGSGRTPYIIPLGIDAPPTGALGYVNAALELAGQIGNEAWPDAIVVGSGSALTHAGLVLGLKLLGIETTVYGVCVRRNAQLQAERVLRRARETARMLELQCPVTERDIHLTDIALSPGYGKLNEVTSQAIKITARLEGLFLDPVYTGKTMAGLLHLVQQGELSGKSVLFWHTGGQPALFGYQDQLDLGQT